MQNMATAVNKDNKGMHSEHRTGRGMQGVWWGRWGMESEMDTKSKDGGADGMWGLTATWE